MPPPIAIFTLAIIWLSGIGFGPHAFGVGTDTFVHLRIGDVGRIERPRRPAKIAGAVDQRLRPSLHVLIARVWNAYRMRQNPRGKRSCESGKEIDHLAARQPV